MLHTTIFYVYTLARPDGRVFYVGKGKDDRIFQHEYEAKGKCRCHKCNVIRKIWRDGGEVQHEVVFRTEDEQAAFEREIELIALYGRKNLVNQTDGGQGVSGRLVSDETRAKIGAKNKARYSTPEERARLSEKAKRQMSDPEAKAKLIEAQRAHVNDPERLARALEKRKLITDTPEWKERESVRKKEMLADPAIRQKISQKMREHLSNPENRAAMSRRMTERYSNPENRAAASRRTSEYYRRRRLAAGQTSFAEESEDGHEQG